MENERITIGLAIKKIVYEDCAHKELKVDSKYKYAEGEHGFVIIGNNFQVLYPWNNIIYIFREKGE